MYFSLLFQNLASPNTASTDPASVHTAAISTVVSASLTASPTVAPAHSTSFSDLFDDLAVAIVTNKGAQSSVSNTRDKFSYRGRRPAPTVRDMLRQNRSMTSQGNSMTSPVLQRSSLDGTSSAPSPPGDGNTSLTRGTVSVQSQSTSTSTAEVTSGVQTPRTLRPRDGKGRCLKSSDAPGNVQVAIPGNQEKVIVGQESHEQAHPDVVQILPAALMQTHPLPNRPPPITTSHKRLRSALVSDLLAMRRSQEPSRLRGVADLYGRAKTVNELLRERKQQGSVSRSENTDLNITVGRSMFTASNSSIQRSDDVTVMLPRDREVMLANHITQLSLLGYKYYVIQVLQLATQMSEYYQLKNPDGTLLNERWYSGFLSRWPHASVAGLGQEVVPTEALKNINWDLVDLAATQDALQQEGHGGTSGGTDQSSSSKKKKSASELLTGMVLSGIKKYS